MTDSHKVTIWDGLTLGLWSLFFIVGLAPELFFHGFRIVARVTTHHAFVNSSAVITVGFSAYIAFFVSRQCRRAGLNDGDAHGKALQVGILAMIAFLELPSQSAVFGTQTLLLLMLQSFHMSDPYLRNVILLVGCCKLISWFYLYSLMLRFHLMGRRHVFSRMPTFFLSHHHTDTSKRNDHSDTHPPNAH